MSVCAKRSRRHFRRRAAVHRDLRGSIGSGGQSGVARPEADRGSAGLAEVLLDGRAADQHGVLEGFRAGGLERPPGGGAVVDVQAFESGVGRAAAGQRGPGAAPARDMEGVLVADDSDHRRPKRTGRIWKAHKVFDKKTGYFFERSARLDRVLSQSPVLVPERMERLGVVPRRRIRITIAA